MHNLKSKTALHVGSLLVGLFFFNGCATRYAYSIGHRTCAGPVTEVSEITRDSKHLFISYRCNLRTETFFIGSRSLGQGAATAKVELEHLFMFSSATQIPVDFSAGRQHAPFRTKVSITTGDSNPSECEYASNSASVLTYYFGCDTRKREASLAGVMRQVNEGFDYRTIWGFAALPIALPLGVAVDIVTSPVYAVVAASLHGKSISGQPTEATDLIARSGTPNHAHERLGASEVKP